MHISKLTQSKFLTRADVGSGVLATIEDVFHENVAKEGAPEELKVCISFTGVERPLVLNKTNKDIIISILASRGMPMDDISETDNWRGQQIVLYDDPNVPYQGKLVGGIRVRAPRGKAATAQQQKPAATPAPSPLEPEPPDDDVPF